MVVQTSIFLVRILSLSKILERNIFFGNDGRG